MKDSDRKPKMKPPDASPVQGSAHEEDSDSDSESQHEAELPTGLPVEYVPRVAVKKSTESDVESGNSADSHPVDERDGIVNDEAKEVAGATKGSGRPQKDLPIDQNQSDPEENRERRLRPSHANYDELLPSEGFGKLSEEESAARREEIDELRKKYGKVAHDHENSRPLEIPGDFRTVHREAVKGKFSEGLDSWDRLRQWSSSRIIAQPILALVVVAVVVLLFSVWNLGNLLETNKPTTAAIVTPDTSILQSWDEIAPRIQSLVSSFVEADSWENKLAYICAPERLREQVRDYYENQNPPDLTVKTFNKILPMMMGEVPVYFVQFEDENFDIHHVDVFDWDGGLKLNWESLVAYGTMPWDQFCKERPTTPQKLRVYAMPADFYLAEYSDRERYQSYRITHRSGAPDLYGYVKRGSPTAEALRSVCRISHAQPVHLSLAFPENSSRTDCVDISGFIHNQWAPLETIRPPQRGNATPGVPNPKKDREELEVAPSTEDKPANSSD